MRTKITYLIQSIFWLLLSTNVFGQKNCSKIKLFGEWEYLKSFAYRQPFMIDSLINSAEKFNKVLGIWTYKDDGTYYYKSDTIKYNKKGTFNIIEEKCEIRLSKKKKTPEGLVFHILFLDDKYLIKKCTKPKGDYIYINRRK